MAREATSRRISEGARSDHVWFAKAPRLRFAGAMKLASLVIVLLPARVARAEAPKDPDTAATLAIAGSIAPMSLMAVGLRLESHTGMVIAGTGLALSVVTPSLGHWYAGYPLTGGMWVRALGAAVVLYGVGDMEHADDLDPFVGGAALSFAGLGILGLGAAIDVATAPAAAEEANRQLTVAPIVVGSHGDHALGIGVSGAF